MLDDRYDSTGDPRRLTGRKEISDYTGGTGAMMLIGSVAIIAGIFVFGAAFPGPTKTAYNHALKRTVPQQMPPVTTEAPVTQ
jgi:hypothetical protein